MLHIVCKSPWTCSVKCRQCENVWRAHECHFSRQVQYLGHLQYKVCLQFTLAPLVRPPGVPCCTGLSCHVAWRDIWSSCNGDEQIGNGIQLSTFETLHSRLLKFTTYMPHSTLHTAQSTLHTLRFNFHTTLWTPHFHFLHSILYPVHSTHYILHSTICALHSTL